jgi:hypothetical protein
MKASAKKNSDPEIAKYLKQIEHHREQIRLLKEKIKKKSYTKPFSDMSLKIVFD